jgi:helix-turn-helix protein
MSNLVTRNPNGTLCYHLSAISFEAGRAEREAAVKAAVEAERTRIADAKPKMLLTVRLQADRAGISESHVRSLVASKRLEHVHIGGRVMIPVGAFEEFLQAETVKPCRDETKVPSSAGSQSVTVTTSPGQSTAGAASARRARKIADELRRPSPSGSTPEAAETARVIPLKSS